MCQKSSLLGNLKKQYLLIFSCRFKHLKSKNCGFKLLSMASFANFKFSKSMHYFCRPHAMSINNKFEVSKIYMTTCMCIYKFCQNYTIFKSVHNSNDKYKFVTNWTAYMHKGSKNITFLYPNHSFGIIKLIVYPDLETPKLS